MRDLREGYWDYNPEEDWSSCHILVPLLIVHHRMDVLHPFNKRQLQRYIASVQ